MKKKTYKPLSRYLFFEINPSNDFCSKDCQGFSGKEMGKKKKRKSDQESVVSYSLPAA